MKKITSVLLFFVMLATLFTTVPVTATTADGFAGGTGRTDDPFLVSDAQQLSLVSELVNSGATYTDADGAIKYYYEAAYKLTADIDFERGDWTPIGQALPLSYDTDASKEVRNPEFKGTFDGDGYVVKNIRMRQYQTDPRTEPLSAYMGFFGSCNRATIKNLGLDGVDIQWFNYDYIYDTANNKKERVKYLGGLAGVLYLSKVSDCYVINSNIMNTNGGTNDTAHGGFVGALNYGNTIDNCYVYNIKMEGGVLSYESGFAGLCMSNGNTINNCYAAEIKHTVGKVHPTIYGFARDTDTPSANVTNCYSTLGDAQGAGVNAGGVSRAYQAKCSLGVSSMTSDALINAVLATGVYEQNPNINNGYPYLKKGFDGTAATDYEGGSGTKSDPYLIATPGQLLRASRMVASGQHTSSWFKLTKDIDFNYQEWQPIGSARLGETQRFFLGGFDGANHIIKNISITNTSTETAYKEIGFFGFAKNAEIKNLGIENMRINVNNSRTNSSNPNIDYIGGFIACAMDTKIENCFIKNSSVWQENIYWNMDGELGGFVGLVRGTGTEIKNCYVYNVTFKNAWQKRSSGFAGRIYAQGDGSFENCFAASVGRASETGAIETTFGFGYESTSSRDPKSVVNCYSTLQGTTGRDGTAVPPVAYNADLAFGDEGASKKTIVDNFKNIESFETTDTSINGGFPYLAFEKAAEAPDFIIERVANEIKLQTQENDAVVLTSNHTVTVDITRRPGVAEVAKVYVAGYDIDGRLTGAQSATVNLDDFSFTADVDAEKAKIIKVFLWDNAQSSLVDPYAANITEYDQFEEVWSAENEQSPRKTRLVMMGDSIMDSVENGSSYSWRKWGWQDAIDYYLTDDITAIKHGHNGQTVKMFIDGRTSYHVCSWETISADFGKGDYVVLSLGRNDSGSIAGTKPVTFTVDDFKNWYREIIADVKAKKATIILMTPIPGNGDFDSVTDRFDADKVCTNVRQVIIDLAEENDVAYIDMAKLYSDALNEMIESGEYTSEELRLQKSGSTVTGPGVIFVDSVHLTEKGADLLAKIFAEEIQKMSTGLENFIVFP